METPIQSLKVSHCITLNCQFNRLIILFDQLPFVIIVKSFY